MPAADTSEISQATLGGPRQKNVLCLGGEGGGEVFEFLDGCDGSVRFVCDMKLFGPIGSACCDEALIRMVNMQRLR